jgi:predicted metallopeptidase
MEWKKAPDIKREVDELARELKLDYLDLKRVFCFRSYGSRSRARARIWSLPRIWQQALKTEAGYCLEVISERFDRLAAKEQQRILIHELLHIPKNFSGSLLPHRNKKGEWLERKVKELSKKINE